MSQIAEATCEVQNVPNYALVYPYWVVTAHRKELWFWGAFMHRKEAEEAMWGDDQIIVEFEFARQNRKKVKEHE